MESIQKFQDLLKRIFQFETSNLDFGIYRILNYKREQIEKFIQEDLKNKVEGTFAKHKDERLTNINQRFKEAKQDLLDTAKKLGKEPVTPAGDLKDEFKDSELGRKYLSLKAQKDGAETIDEIKLQVFNDLYNFFSRYYEEGDFVPQYRYSIKGHKYAIPYNGEEVKLYWANNEQYYTKTGLLFRDYTFTPLDSLSHLTGFKANDYKVIFRIVSAKEELGSKKATKQRFFILDGKNPVEKLKDKALIIHFQYRELTEEEVKGYGVEGGSNTSKQEKINQQTYENILKEVKDIGIKESLGKEYKNEKPILLYQISRFTAKNTKDYFIHKNLKKFLSEQLDYFIKAEVLDIETLEKERFLDKHITRAKVVREIGGDIIGFLSQIEDFQKKLWEKKKFVLKTEYVITTDRVPEELHQEISSSKEQKQEWKDLGFELPKTKEELKNKKLPIDTKYFPQEFKERLLERLTSSPLVGEDKGEGADLDDLLDGLLIKSENCQALNLLLEKYSEKVKCIYIDPPYNTGSDEFLYKDRYQHSSWLSMMFERLEIARKILKKDGIIFISIDDNEVHNLRALGEAVFGISNFIANVVWHKKYTRSNDATWFSDNHDHILTFAKQKDFFRFNLLPRTEKQLKAYSNPDNHPKGSWKATPLHAKSGSGTFEYTFKNGIKWSPPPSTYPRFSEETLAKLDENNEIWFGEDGKSTPCRKTFLKEAKEGVTPITLWPYEEVGHTHEAVNELKALFPSNPYRDPKPTRLVKRIIELTAKIESTSVVLDFFAGSGTTTHAIMKLNKEDGGKRKYILVEMANYFDTVIIPRLKKVCYSFNWKDGKPQDADGISQFFKYHILEQYEDTLDNIELTPNKQAELKFGDDYLLKYFLDYETRENPSLLNIDQLKNPYLYKLKVNLEEVGEPQEMVVDIPETFNYLLGLKVKKIKAREIAEFIPNEIASATPRKDKKRKYLFVLGEKEGKDIAIVWREYDDNWNEDDFKEDKEFIIKELEPWSPHIVYVNGQSVLTPKLGKHPVEIRYIEPEFKKLMEA